MTQNRLSFAGSQTLLASENEFSSTGNFNSTDTVGDARRLNLTGPLVLRLSEGLRNELLRQVSVKLTIQNFTLPDQA